MEVEHVVQKISEPRRAAGLGPSPRGVVEGYVVARVDFWAGGDAPMSAGKYTTGGGTPVEALQNLASASYLGTAKEPKFLICPTFMNDVLVLSS